MSLNARHREWLYPKNLRHVLTISLSALLLLALANCPTSWAAAQKDSLLMLNIASLPTSTSAKTVQAKLLIDAPPQLVWNTLTNYAALKNILPGYEKSNVIANKGAGKLLDISMKVSAFLPPYQYQVNAQENRANYYLTLTRVSGDFNSLKATYQLIPQGNGEKTILAYTLMIDPGNNLPGSQALIRSNTERSLKALERYSEQEARKSLIGQR